MSDLSADMQSYALVPSSVYSEMALVKLAREIAMDIKELDDILKIHSVSRKEFESLKTNARFVAILSAEVAAWQTAINTNERVKLKSGAMVEEWLPELYARMNDRGESLSSKVEAGKLLERLSGMGSGTPKNEAPTDRISITINLGADNKLEFEKNVTPKIIEHEDTPHGDSD